MVKITRLDFSQVPGRIRIEMLDVSMQDISDDVVIVTSLFHIHLPNGDDILSRKSARLVLVFRLEREDWKIVHSGISIPYGLVREGEVYPVKGLHERTRELEMLVEERTRALEAANRKLEALRSPARRPACTSTRASASRQASPARSKLRRLAMPVSASVLLVARYGGEECVVLVPGTSRLDAFATARYIQNEVWALALPHADTAPGIVTVSLGVASVVPSTQHTSEHLVRDADSALYRAKQLGRNCLQSETG